MPENLKQDTARNPGELYRKGLIALEGGQYDYAVSLFREALSIEPGFTRASDGIKAAKARKLRKSGPLMRKIKKPLYAMQGAFYRKINKTDLALDKYESAFSLPEASYTLLLPLAELYFEKGMTENAAAACKAFLQRDADNMRCLRKLGKIYIEQGNMAEAKKVFDRLSHLAPADDAVMKEVKDAYALLTIDRGRWDEEGSFRQKTRTGEGGAEKLSGGGEIPAGEKSRLGDMAARLKKQLEDKPDDTALQQELADTLRDLRKTREAEQLYKIILRKEPDNMEALRSIGNLYIKSGEYDKASKILEHINSLLPENTNVLKILAETYMKQDAPLKAIEAFLKLAKITPGDAELHESLGKLYEQNRYFEEAVKHYDRVIALRPEKSAFHEKIGNLYLRDAKTDKAIERYEKASEAAPEDIRLKENLADIYLQDKRFEEAENIFREILKASPGDKKTREKLEEAELNRKEKRLEEAETSLKELHAGLEASPGDEGIRAELERERGRAAGLRVEALAQKLKNKPDNDPGRFELGRALMEKGDIDGAVKEFQKSARSREKEVESLHLLGLCFEKKKILDIAARQLEKAEAKLPEMNDIKKAVLYDLGRVYEKTGEKEKAVSKFKEIYEEDISYRDVSGKIEDAYRGD